MSKVYRAQQQVALGAQRTQRPVAVKILHDHLARSGAETQQFIHEINLMARLNSPHLAAFYEAGRTDAGHIFVVMELVQGMTLRDLFTRAPDGLPLGRALQVAEQVGRALKTLHDVGVLHRDVKPENVMIANDGAVKLLDLGIAKVQGQRGAMTESGVLAGTPAYMAPEQIRGEAVDARCDVYALAVLTVEMITGRLPFAMARPSSAQGMHSWLPVHLGARLPFPAVTAVPPHVADALARALDPDPQRRPRSIGELLLLLAGPAHTEVSTLMHSHHPSQAPRSREWLFLAGGVLLALVLMGAFGLGLYVNRAQPAPAVVSAPPTTTVPAAPLPAAPLPAAPASNSQAARAATVPTVDPASHDPTFREVLRFHYARVGGRAVPHLGQLERQDGRFFSLNGMNDTITFVAPEGYEFVADGHPEVADVEVDVHAHDRAEQRYEVDVSYAHRDGNDPNWTELVEGEAHVAHTCDIDHVRLRAARYLRIRNISNERVDIDAVFVRRYQPCSDPAACRNVQHGG
jgi:hypothetical protein